MDTACLWMTGLPGSGKSTLSDLLLERLRPIGVLAYGLDGDALRRGLNGDLGYSDRDRSENSNPCGIAPHLGPCAAPRLAAGR